MNLIKEGNSFIPLFKPFYQINIKNHFHNGNHFINLRTNITFENLTDKTYLITLYIKKINKKNDKFKIISNKRLKKKENFNLPYF